MKWMLVLFTMSGQPVDPELVGGTKYHVSRESCDMQGFALSMKYKDQGYTYSCIEQK
jgi:hypothetical protein